MNNKVLFFKFLISSNMFCRVWRVLSFRIDLVIVFILPFSATKTCFNCLRERCRDGDIQKETCIWDNDVCGTWKYRNARNGTQSGRGDIYKMGCVRLLLIVEGCWPDGNYDLCVCNSDSCNEEMFHTNLTAAEVRRSRRKGLGRKIKKRNRRRRKKKPSS